MVAARGKRKGKGAAEAAPGGRRTRLVFDGDFLRDLGERVSLELSAAGFSMKPGLTTEELCQAHQNVERRRIRPRIRDVVRSAELKAKALALPPHAREGLSRLTVTSTAGGDLWPFQSRALAHARGSRPSKANATAPDALLNDWGINHLHLGPIRPDGVAQGHKEIVFVRVSENRLFFIDVLGHDFAEVQLLEILHRNWPELLAEQRETVKLHPSSEPTTSADVRAARAAGLNVVVTLRDGTVYASPGGGQMTNGLGRNVQFFADGLLDKVQELEADCRREPGTVRAAFEKQSGRTISDLRVRLVIDPGGAFLIEHLATGTLLRVPRKRSAPARPRESIDRKGCK